MTVKPSSPGLAKTRRLPLIRKRTVQLWEATDYHWHDFFESADVMSEGATRAEPEGSTYYGSTSVVLRAASLGGPIADNELERVAAALRHDPHARLRAIRIAYLEAKLRAQASVFRMLADLTVRCDDEGIRIEVEVEERGTVPKSAGRVAAAPQLSSSARSMCARSKSRKK
jgi:hypothetical protein